MSDLSLPLLLALDVRPLAEPSLFAAACAAVEPERREAVQQLHRTADRCRSLGAGLLLQHGLTLLGIPQEERTLVRGEHGKPALRSGAVQFSLSHDGDLALCALDSAPLGCDAAEIVPRDFRVARRFAPEEQDALAALPDDETRLRQFYRYWTLKESLMKATGLGFAMPLRASRFRLTETGAELLSDDPAGYHFREFSDLPGYQITLCCTHSPEAAVLRLCSADELLNR